MSKIPDFIKEVNNKLLFSGKDLEMIAYIPEKYFERNVAEQNGEYINILGIFSYTVQNNKTNKNIGLKQFRFPSIFTTKPGSIEKVKDVILTKDSVPEAYRIFRYEDGDEIASSIDTVQSIANVEKMINVWYSLGYVNNAIPYDKLLDYVIDTMTINGYSYNLNMQIVGSTLSELCRDKDDLSKPFRLSKAIDNNNMHGYKTISLNNISKFISPYTALLSADFDESVMYGIMNDTPKSTPLEKILAGIED